MMKTDLLVIKKFFQIYSTVFKFRINCAKQNKTDGIKFIWENKWVHLRSSNTEPIIRIYAEAATEKVAKDLIVKVKSLL